MIFAIHCLDKTGPTDHRAPYREAHGAHMRSIADQIAFAGPLLGANGATIVGSLIVADFSDRQALEKWLFDEPFYKNGLFAKVDIHVFDNRWPQRAGFVPPQA